MKVRVYGKKETSNLQYEPDVSDDIDNDLKSGSDTEEDNGEYSENADYSGLILTVNEKNDDEIVVSKKDLVHQRLCFLNHEHTQKSRNYLRDDPML